MGDGSADVTAQIWHVTVTVAGPPVDVPLLRAALGRLGEEQPFLLSLRYAPDRVELRYWDQASCLDDAAAMGLRLWGEHRSSARLPPWSVVGLEVVDRDTFQRRAVAPAAVAALEPAGAVLPL